MAARISRHMATIVALLGIATVAGAQAMSLPPIRPLGPIVATARDTFADLAASVMQLSDGRVLVNDQGCAG